MTRRRASCCCDAALPCDALNLQCFGSTVPPKYVRIDGARSEYHRDNVLAQDATGARCDCPGPPFYTFTLSEILHLEGPRVFVADGTYSGYAYQLTGTRTTNFTEIFYCAECIVPQPARICPSTAFYRKITYRARATFSVQLRCVTCLYDPDNPNVFGRTYGIVNSVAQSAYLQEETRYVCCDPASPPLKFTDRGSGAIPFNLVFDANPATVCNFNRLCRAGPLDYVNAFFPQQYCSSFFGVQPEYRYSGSIKAVFSTV